MPKFKEYIKRREKSTPNGNNDSEEVRTFYQYLDRFKEIIETMLYVTVSESKENYKKEENLHSEFACDFNICQFSKVFYRINRKKIVIIFDIVILMFD